jgi:hypothetical protein
MPARLPSLLQDVVAGYDEDQESAEYELYNAFLSGSGSGSSSASGLRMTMSAGP